MSLVKRHKTPMKILLTLSLWLWLRNVMLHSRRFSLLKWDWGSTVDTQMVLR